jgi:hypothetical protein
MFQKHAKIGRSEMRRLISQPEDHEPEVMEPVLVFVFLALAIIAALVGLL